MLFNSSFNDGPLHGHPKSVAVRIERLGPNGPEVVTRVLDASTEDGSAPQTEEKTLTTLNDAGQPVESRCGDALLKVRYDDEERQVESTIVFEEHPEMNLRIETLYPAADLMINNCYLPNGHLLSRAEKKETENGTEITQTLYDPMTQLSLTTYERRDQKDQYGNWTRKTIFRRDGKMETVTSLITRTITY
jgi:hypothetical protein